MREKELYEFGNFRLDVVERVLERLDGEKIDVLPEKAFQTLALLVRRSGSLVSKDELIEHVWPDTIVEDNNLEKAIHAIRSALGEKRDGVKYVETVRKHGYRFIEPVKRLEEDRIESSQLHPTAKNLPHHALTRRGSREMVRAGVAAFAVVSLVALGLVIWYGSAGPRTAASNKNTDEADREGSRSAAFDLYIRGKVKVATENRDETLEAIGMLEEAVGLDPNFAKAYTALARGYNTMAFKYSSGSERKSFHENAEVAIEKALSLDPELAEAHFARGLILWSNTEGFPHEQAINSYKRSLTLDPNNDETHHQLSLVYSHIGLINEARREVARALEINPNNTLARYRTGVYVSYRGEFDAAIEVYKTIPRDFTPLLVDRTVAEALIQTGRTDEAQKIVEDYLTRYPKDEGGSFSSVKALLLAKASRHDEAEAMIRQAEEIGNDYGHFHHTAYNIACAFAAMGRADDALLWLERTSDSGFPNYEYFRIDPNLDPIRQEKRFVEFMGRMRERWERFKAIV